MNKLTQKIIASAKLSNNENLNANKKHLLELFEDDKEGLNKHLLDYLILSIVTAAENDTDLLETLKNYYKGPHIKIWIPIVPPGVNQTYGVNCKSKQKVYKTPAAKQWENDAIMPIRSAANSNDFRIDPKNDRLNISILMLGSGHDVDAPIKMIIDTVARVLGFDDKIVMHVSSDIDRSYPERGVLIEIEKEIL